MSSGMYWFANKYSYLITAALAMGGAWAASTRVGGLAPTLAVAGVGLGLAAVQRKLRGGRSNVGNWEQIDQAIGHGSPTMLFLYSDT